MNTQGITGFKVDTNGNYAAEIHLLPCVYNFQHEHGKVFVYSINARRVGSVNPRNGNGNIENRKRIDSNPEREKGNGVRTGEDRLPIERSALLS